MAKVIQEDAIAVVTVHGTGDTALDADGPKWWQRGSAFSERLKARLSQHGVRAEIVPHFWSGANSASDRETGADTLATLIKTCAKKYKGVHVVGHSHGGNVANDAADFLRWGRRRLRRNARDPISSVTTVGTPFFNVKTDVSKRGAGIAFMGVTWASVILFPLLAIGWLIGLIAQYVLVDGTVRQRFTNAEAVGEPIVSMTIEQAISNEINALHLQSLSWLFYLVVFGLAVRFMWRMSTRGIRRVMRPKRLKESPATMFSVWHPNDEAISFLQKIEQVPIEAFPKGALYRGSRTSAVGLGVLAVMGVGVVIPFALLAVAASKALASRLNLSLPPDLIEFISDGGAWIFSGLALLVAPIVFSIFFLLYRYLVGNVLEWTVRGLLNGQVAGTLRGIAYGKDGDQVLCNVSTTSHTIPCRELVLEGDVAQRMQGTAASAATALLEKYRWSLFSVGADTNASLSEVSKDAMTWDSLIHTTYFDQPEVADAIGDHIAAEAKRLGEA